MSAPRIRRYTDRAAFVEAAAADTIELMAAAIASRGACRIALGGGSTPRPVYERIAQAGPAEGIDWTRVHIFFGDERCVPPEHEASNYRMAKEAMVDRIDRERAPRVHRITGEAPPAEAARAYAAELGESPLDICLLGMGGDGHTASLFPGRPEAAERTARVVAARSPVTPVDRVSLTLRAINEARAVRFWVTGEDKATRVAEVLREIASGEPALPAAQVQPASGELAWFLDEAAARGVK
ncbi:MAG TPA: 6-phosphogluconolactonase [Burkholderiales bacterium]|nr:6-phosphogluconolactonase [Burkholderiales bacterium]